MMAGGRTLMERSAKPKAGPARRMGLVLGLALAALAWAQTWIAPALAQDLFAPRLYVGDRVVTEYEVLQRAMFLKLLRAPGNPEEEALKALIDDKLRLTEAKRLEITLSEKELTDGMNEFAARANLTAEQLVVELAKVGVAAETFRDFVSAGLLWRKAVRQRYVGQVPISDADVYKALASFARPKALKVLVSELVIPAEPGREDEAMALATRLSEEIQSEGAFAAAASRYSAAPTAGRGGRLDWLPLANLPGQIAGQILALGQGDVSAPVSVPGAVVLFLLRDVAMDETAEPIIVNVTWAEFLVPDDAAEIAQIKTEVDQCNDLYGQAKGLPEDRLTVTTATMGEIAQDVGLELAKLDAGEISTALTRGGARRLLMLCAREPVSEALPTRAQIKEQVLNLKLEGLAENYLEELRAAAIIREP
jgi:peptidyl-prolyl cis-trans isomerase SurA